MDLNPYLATLRESLAATASAGDEQLQRSAAVLAATLDPAARLTLMSALSDLATEVTSQLPDHVVEVRLDGRDVRVVVSSTHNEPPEPPETPEPPPPPPPPGESGDISRMTLRLFEQLKSQAEQAAAAQGVSLNTFVAQAVQGALQGGYRHGGHRHGGPGGRGRGGHRHGGPGGRGRGPHGPRYSGPPDDEGGSYLHGWVRG